MDFFSFLVSSKGLGVIASLLVSVWVGRMILKKHKPQAILFLAGITLFLFVIIISLIFGESPKIIGNPNFPPDHILNRARTLDNAFLDIFVSIEGIFSNRVAGLGLLIMSVMGFVKFMDSIGANKALVRIGVKPLQFIKNPYVVLVLAFFVGQMMKMAITSAAGLGVLLMATMFPILLRLGVSRAAATAVIATTGCIDLGPAAGIGVAIAESSGILTSDGKADMATYFIKYQLPVAIPVLLTVGILHFIVQFWFDKRDGYVFKPDKTIETTDDDTEKAPSYYAVLPVLPLFLVLLLNEMIILEINKALAFIGTSIVIPPKTIGLMAAVSLSVFITMIIEYVRLRDARRVFDSIQTVFDGMGYAFATIVTLIVAGEVFASGLFATGSINTLLESAKDSGVGIIPFSYFLQGLITLSTLLMGSGDAAIFSFISVGAVVAEHFGVEPVAVLMPMQICSSLARAFSPITAVVVAVSTIAGLSPVEVVKRTAIPMIGGIIVLTIVNTVLFL